jgi:hypothetical protein
LFEAHITRYLVMISFDQFLDLQEGHRNAGKTGLYPLGYDGIGNYPPADIMTSAADALYYLSIDDRFSSWWEGSPFSISHIPGKPVQPREHGLPGILKPPKPHGISGFSKPHKDHGMPGDERPPKDSPLPGKPEKDCLVKKPSQLNPQWAGRKAEKCKCPGKMPPI